MQNEQTISENYVFEVVKQKILEIIPDLNEDLVVPQKSLVDLGLNSIDRADVITMSMEALNTTIPVYEFQQGIDIQTIVSILYKYVGK